MGNHKDKYPKPEECYPEYVVQETNFGLRKDALQPKRPGIGAWMQNRFLGGALPSEEIFDPDFDPLVERRKMFKLYPELKRFNSK